MRTTRNKTEKITDTFVICVCPLSPARVVLTLTVFETKGGET